jgi:hypothetical protein
MLDGGNNFQNVSTANMISSHTGSEEAFFKTSNWLKQCIDHHGRCESAADVPLPRRDFNLEALDSETQLKLHETDNEIRRYMRLSHCWGDF